VCKVSSKSIHKPGRSRRYKFVSTDRQTDRRTDTLIPVYSPPLTSLRGYKKNAIMWTGLKFVGSVNFIIICQFSATLSYNTKVKCFNATIGSLYESIIISNSYWGLFGKLCCWRSEIAIQHCVNFIFLLKYK
jgi:hypothetical protein